MSNISVSSDLRIASAIADPTLTSVPSASSSTEQSGAALYPQLSPGAVAGSLAQLKNTPIILFQPRGEEVMQQVGPKGTPSPGGYQPNSVSAACSDGKLANAGDAAGQAVGGVLGPNGSTFGGMLGREMGGILCEADDAFFTPIGSSSEPEQAPAEEGGMSMMPAGPSMDGGFSSDPSVGGSSSAGSYIDPETGEPITNKDGKTIAGDPNADSGTYIGEVDDPNFTGDQSNSSSGSSESSSSTQGTNTDNSTPDATDPDDTSSEETHETSDPDPGPKPDGDMPADDGSGSGGPAGPRANVEISSGADRFYLPSDDSAGGGTPRSNVANVTNSGASSSLFAVALSRSQLM